jgi:SAM-dependent methyltransferase
VRALRLLSASLRDFGVAHTLRAYPSLLFASLLLRDLKRRKLDELSRDGFDAAHGTDTAAVLVGRALGATTTRSGHLVVHYETTSEAAIRAPLDGLTLDFSAFTFVDLGCGKGKPLMVAATYPFRRLVGVDISPVCVAAARRNLAEYRPEPVDGSRVELLTVDAEDFRFPEDPLVVYLFNPFPGRVLGGVVTNLEASLRARPRPVALIYVNPHALDAVAGSPLFTRAAYAEAAARSAVGLAPYEGAAVFVTHDLLAAAPAAS